MTQNETEDERLRRLIREELNTGSSPTLHTPAPAIAQQVSLSDVLDNIDPRDSESAIEIFGWLVDNGRLHRIATLTEGGYLFAYQEPKGSSREGWIAGGTTGDRVVDDALDQAKAQGAGPAAKGLCKHCFSAIQRLAVDEYPQAENPRPDADPFVCDKAADGHHEFAG